MNKHTSWERWHAGAGLTSGPVTSAGNSPSSRISPSSKLSLADIVAAASPACTRLLLSPA